MERDPRLTKYESSYNVLNLPVIVQPFRVSPGEEFIPSELPIKGKAVFPDDTHIYWSGPTLKEIKRRKTLKLSLMASPQRILLPCKPEVLDGLILKGNWLQAVADNCHWGGMVRFDPMIYIFILTPMFKKDCLFKFRRLTRGVVYGDIQFTKDEYRPPHER